MCTLSLLPSFFPPPVLVVAFQMTEYSMFEATDQTVCLAVSGGTMLGRGVTVGAFVGTQQGGPAGTAIARVAS